MIFYPLQDLGKNLFRPVFIQDRGKLIHHEDVIFQLRNQAFIRPGHQLHEKAAGCFDGGVRIHQHAQPARRRDLLAFDQIGGKIFRDLSADQCDRAHIGLFQADVPADGKASVSAHGSAHIKLSVRTKREIHERLPHIAPDTAGRIRHCNDAPDRSVPCDADGQSAVFLLHGIAEQGSRTECSAERR